MLKELNPIIHSQLRLSIMTLLLSVEEADFTWLKEQTGATSTSCRRRDISTSGRNSWAGRRAPAAA